MSHLKLLGVLAAALLAVLLLQGWGSGTETESSPPAVAQINPYPPGLVTPFYFRTAAQWQEYAEEGLDPKQARRE